MLCAGEEIGAIRCKRAAIPFKEKSIDVLSVNFSEAAFWGSARNRSLYELLVADQSEVKARSGRRSSCQ